DSALREALVSGFSSRASREPFPGEERPSGQMSHLGRAGKAADDRGSECRVGATRAPGRRLAWASSCGRSGTRGRTRSSRPTSRPKSIPTPRPEDPEGAARGWSAQVDRRLPGFRRPEGNSAAEAHRVERKSLENLAATLSYATTTENCSGRGSAPVASA